MAGDGSSVPGPVAASDIPVPHGNQRVLLAVLRCQSRAYLRAGSQEPPDGTAHHGVGHRVRPSVGWFGSDIPLQRGAAHTALHQPVDTSRAYDRVSVQPHENAAARRPFLGFARYGETFY